MSEERVRVGITQGDINGIGYEVIIKALQDARINDFCTPIVYGSPKVAAYHRKAVNVESFIFNPVKDVDEANPRRSNLINVMDDNVRVDIGKSTPMGGQGSILSLEAAVADLKAGKIDVIVTAPINKNNVQTDTFHFPGHTEYFAKSFDCDDALMLMVSDVLKIGVVTGHIPLEKVSESITMEVILKKLTILNKTLIQDFGIRKPRIAVLGLNPHSGDNGLLGKEEIDVIIPALETARNKGILALGPYPADGFFGSEGFSKFDAVLAMYHDQGLIPFKSMVFDEGVNFTAGLPIIRTSPVHGTAYEIAGKDEANANSFRSAIYLACDLFNNRKLHKEISANPLKTSRMETESGR
ncbi:4-hydroxythreonine-4-phosphate dehydrogenase PdxA [Williamwhitmania taraxaci]|uniref:4-hydroxythreonine-4-phosphate dehydrogenase n=1 Tax=Williamwhitmania taraxaci TaxID=1640674 RepID=A0A1G6LZE6_9BACT|nr:4-hydroxythreonine-4-phosphate dehydrogenase PdxA [Williamwhitmania taraxaci]SDC48652.1 4-hydroxythreonine-4-phosphate dehydrogenase [Williamwhitmania taraxaci]